MPRRRTINAPGHWHFLTFSVYRRKQLLVSDWSRDLVCGQLDAARQHLDYDIIAYVIMPEHVHVLVRPRQHEYDVGNFRGMLKRKVADAVRARLLELGRDDWIESLTVTDNGRKKFRFWQKGGGYDENLWSQRPILAVIDYIHDNPVRRGLVQRPEDWRYSSAEWFISRREGNTPTDDVPLIPDPIRW